MATVHSQKKRFKLGLPLQLGILLIISLLIGNMVPLVAKQAAYAISLSIKEVLIFVLPAIIFSFLFACLLSFKQGALTFILTLMVTVCLSNTFTVFMAYGVSALTLPHLELKIASTTIDELKPLWNFSMPGWLPNQYALLLGLICGTYFSYKPSATATALSQKLKHYALTFLNKYFIPLVPLFVFGFLMKLDHEDLLVQAVKTYGPIFLVVIVVDFGYVLLLFGLATRFKPTAFFQALKNAFPSAITGFSTMSSAATMPITLQGAEANTKDPIMAEAIIPATVNIHLIGDSIAIPILAIATMLTFGHPMPDIHTFLPFALYFVATKFAVAAVPGGSIFILIPVVEAQLGFTGEMASIMSAIYIMIDALGTATSVLGNGAFAMLFTQGYNKLFPKSHTIEQSTLAEADEEIEVN